MNSFVTNFSRMQEQVTTMNSLVRARSKQVFREAVIYIWTYDEHFIECFIERFIAHFIKHFCSTFCLGVYSLSVSTACFRLHLLDCSLKNYKIVIFFGLLRNGQNVNQYTFYWEPLKISWENHIVTLWCCRLCCEWKFKKIRQINSNNKWQKQCESVLNWF